MSPPKKAGRRPVDVLAASKKPTGRQGIWNEIRIQRRFNVSSIAIATDIPRKTVRDYLAALLAGRYIAEIGPKLVYDLVRDVGADAPRLTKTGQLVTLGAAREQMWRTIKIIGGDFDFHDIAIAASLEDSKVDPLDAKDYLHNLAAAGYIRIVKRGGPGRATRYRFLLTMNTGPKPPMVQRMRTVFDPNLGKIVWHPPVES